MADQDAFLGAAKLETMWKDFERLRKAIREHDSFATEAAWDRCERWVGQLRSEAPLTKERYDG